MKKFKKIFLPNGFILFLLILVSLFGLITVFKDGLELTFIAYCIYALSTYTLIVAIYKFIIFSHNLKQKIVFNKYINYIMENPIVNKYFNDILYRRNISLYQGLGMNLLYACFKYIIGFVYVSTWDLSIAIYYTMLSIIKLNLVRVTHKSEKIIDLYQLKKHEIINYTRTGVLLFALNATMSGMVIQMIWQNKTYVYPGYIIYISAFYTFYSFITIMINLFKYRKYNNPILSASNLVSFAGAFMSIFVLQAAMLTQFGNDLDFQRFMNIITGTFIMIIVLFIAIVMVINGVNKMRLLNEEGDKNE